MTWRFALTIAILLHSASGTARAESATLFAGEALDVATTAVPAEGDLGRALRLACSDHFLTLQTASLSEEVKREAILENIRPNPPTRSISPVRRAFFACDPIPLEPATAKVCFLDYPPSNGRGAMTLASLSCDMVADDIVLKLIVTFEPE